MPKTRKNTICKVFGVPKKFDGNVLPTKSDVMKKFLLCRLLLKDEGNGKDRSVRDIAKVIMLELKSVWNKASLPILSDQRILTLIEKLNQQYKSIKRNLSKSEEKVSAFRQLCENTLFDICVCKCKNFLDCMCENKVPKLEREFLKDQRTNRVMVIGNIDRKTSKLLTKGLQRQKKETSSLLSKSGVSENINTNLVQQQLSFQDSSDGNSDSENEDPSFVISSVKTCEAQPLEDENEEQSASSQSHISVERVKLSNLAKACDRTGISDRSASLIVNAVLQDLQVLSKENPSAIIDRSKIRRERKRNRSDLQKRLEHQTMAVRGLYFDGRKDKTMQQEKKGSKYYRRIVTEEHIVLLSQPGSTYLGHVTPTSGRASNIALSIRAFLENPETNYNLDTIKAVGCDGTVINTGLKNGVIRQLEIFLGRPLQWLVCLLHANELPLRHLIEKLDGKTNDPKGFSGTIGKLLEGCEKMPVVPFEAIAMELPVVDVKGLSTDQKYLYEICDGISTGHISSSLSLRQPGKMSHSRWLTTASRILRLYVATREPSLKLRTLAKYVMKVYAPSWFEIKAKPTCKDGSKHFFGMIKKSRYLNKELRDIIDPVLQRNAYFSHPENILVAMLADERKHVRELGLRRILKFRALNDCRVNVRVFQVTTINFKAEDYIDMVDWQTCDATEPPLTKHLSKDDLEKMILDVPDASDILKLPCHTQDVERCIKLVTDVSSSVCGKEARDGIIRARLESRMELPKNDTKK